MKQNKNFLNTLDDWGDIISNTYEQNTLYSITIKGKDIPITIDYMDSDHVNYVIPKGINSVTISKIYNNNRYNNPIEDEFIKFTAAFGKTYIQFYANYENILINNLPAEEFILNMFESNRETYRFARIRKTKELLFSLILSDDTFVLDNYDKLHHSYTITIDPRLKKQMIER